MTKQKDHADQHSRNANADRHVQDRPRIERAVDDRARGARHALRRTDDGRCDAGNLAGSAIWKIPLTYLVPFSVSMYASVSSILAQREDEGNMHL